MIPAPVSQERRRAPSTENRPEQSVAASLPQSQLGNHSWGVSADGPCKTGLARALMRHVRAGASQYGAQLRRVLDILHIPASPRVRCDAVNPFPIAMPAFIPPFPSPEYPDKGGAGDGTCSRFLSTIYQLRV